MKKYYCAYCARKLRALKFHNAYKCWMCKKLYTNRGGMIREINKLCDIEGSPTMVKCLCRGDTAPVMKLENCFMCKGAGVLVKESYDYYKEKLGRPIYPSYLDTERF